jgi:hypothetical protein
MPLGCVRSLNPHALCMNSVTALMPPPSAFSTHVLCFLVLLHDRLSIAGSSWSDSRGVGTARVFDRNLHSMMLLSFTPLLLLKRCHACDQCHSSLVFTPLTGWHCKFRPNTEGHSFGISHLGGKTVRCNSDCRKEAEVTKQAVRVKHVTRVRVRVRVRCRVILFVKRNAMFPKLVRIL